MSIFKTVLIIAFFVVAASARKHQQQRRGRKIGQSGRDFAVAEAAASPAAAQDHAAIEDSLSAAFEQNDVLAAHEDLSAPEAAQASEALQQHLTDAIAVAAETPQAQEVQPEVVAQKVEDSHTDLEKDLKMAKRHQKALKKHGGMMSPEEVVEHHKALQKYLELALHNAEQHNIAVQEDKAIQSGASPLQVAEIAPAVIAGRKFKSG